MKVYVVFTSSNYGEDVYAIYSKEEKAKELCDAMNNGNDSDIFCYCLEMEVDD